MADLFDNICRILATPMPRSRAVKLIAGGLVGAVLAPFGFGQSGPDCKFDTEQACTGGPKGQGYCCPKPQACCAGASNATGARGVCCSAHQQCCTAVGGAKVCCGGDISPQDPRCATAVC
jgi:hypothetical protein